MLHGQEQAGVLWGTVSDTSGAAIPHASVELRGTGLPGVAKTVASDSGRYRVPALPPGEYTIVASAKGFASSDARVGIRLGRAASLDFTLAPAAIATELSVTAQARAMDVTSSASFRDLRGAMLHKLPRGRDFTSLIEVVAGVSQESRLGGLSVDGASAPENTYLIDGVETGHMRTGASGKMLITDFVEEIQVKSSGYAAEFGGATGGVINVLTKSGADTFRGTAGVHYSGSALRSVEHASPSLRPDSRDVVEYVHRPEDPNHRWEPGFELAGPLWKGRAWFFLGYVPLLESTARDVTFVANGASGRFTQRHRTHNLSANLHTLLGELTRLRVAANGSSSKRIGLLPTERSNPDLPFDLDSSEPNWAFSAHADHTIGNRLHLSAGAGRFSFDTHDTSLAGDTIHSFPETNIGLPGIPAELQRPAGFSTSPPDVISRRDLFSRTIGRLEATLYAGRHAAKAGVLVSRIHNDVDRGLRGPLVLLRWDQAYNALDGRQRVRGPFGYYTVRESSAGGAATVGNAALFVQDTWTLGRVTVNAGVRAETESVPFYGQASKAGSSAVEFGLRDKLAPRAGFAWDPAGHGRTRVYASWGIFFDPTKLELSRTFFGAETLVERHYALDTPDWRTIRPGEQLPGAFIEQVDFRAVPDPSARSRKLTSVRSRVMASIATSMRARAPTFGTTRGPSGVCSHEAIAAAANRRSPG